MSEFDSMFWKLLSYQLIFCIFKKNLAWLVKYLVLINLTEHGLLYMASWV